MPASGCPSGTCILSMKSSSQRASSSMSGTLLPLSGMASVPSPSFSDSPVRACSERSYVLSSSQVEMPPLTTYLPWSPASYQPPVTSSV